MAQEFTINSTAIESKINQLLPSQGGFGAGVDFSASTMVIPIVDLTETAEGSDVRQDLQTSLSHNSITTFSVANTTSTLVSTTGYFRVFGSMSLTTTGTCNFFLSDGATNKIVFDGSIATAFTNVGSVGVLDYDFNVFLKAGDTLKAISSAAAIKLIGCTRQIADIDGNLVDP